MSLASQTFTLDRGETARLIVCSEELAKDYGLLGLEQSDIKISYEQYLERCTLEDDAPGLYLTVSLGQSASSSKIDIVSAIDASKRFASVELNVPDRVVAKKASLTHLGNANQATFVLEIVGDNDTDLSQAIPEDIKFPDGPWPQLRLATSDEFNQIDSWKKQGERTWEADRQRIRVVVRSDSEVRTAAKIVVSNAKWRGSTAEVVAFANLPAPSWLTSMAPSTAQFVDIEGTKTRYFEKGQGDPMLLVHGGQAGSPGFAAWSWMPNFDALSENFRVIALDRIGQGGTDNPVQEEAYANYYQTVVDHVAGFIDTQKLEGIHLVGHSQGGWPVTRFALSIIPSLVRSLTIVDSATAAPCSTNAWRQREFLWLLITLYPSLATAKTRESVVARAQHVLVHGQQHFAEWLKSITLSRTWPRYAKNESKRESSSSSCRMNPSSSELPKASRRSTSCEDIESGQAKSPDVDRLGAGKIRKGHSTSGGQTVRAHVRDGALFRRPNFSAFDKAGHLPSNLNIPALNSMQLRR